MTSYQQYNNLISFFTSHNYYSLDCCLLNMNWCNLGHLYKTYKWLFRSLFLMVTVLQGSSQMWTVLSECIICFKKINVKGRSWRFSTFFLLSTNLMCRAKPTMNWSTLKYCVYPKPKISYSSVPKTYVVVQKLLKIHQWVTPLHWLTCFFTTKSLDTLVCLGKGSKD